MKTLIWIILLLLIIIIIYFIYQKYNSLNYDNKLTIKNKNNIVYPFTIQELQSIVKNAKKISIIGSSFSQGYQTYTIYSSAISISMKNFSRFKINTKKHTVLVEAGVIWVDLENKLNLYNYALKVRQASNIFSVGGSLAVNVHGYNHKIGPIINTINYINVMLADSSIKRIMKEDELFPYIIGGYGLFGIIISAELQLIPNKRYIEIRKECKISDYLNNLNNIRNNKDIYMHIYRLSIDPENMLDTGLIVNWILQDNQNINDEKIKDDFIIEEENGTLIQRILVDLGRNNPIIRKLYWNYEKNSNIIGPKSLLECMNPPIKALLSPSKEKIDMLQEFYVSEIHFEKFIYFLTVLLRKNNVILLNSSVRIVPSNKNLGPLSYNINNNNYAILIYFTEDYSNLSKVTLWVQEIINYLIKIKGTYYLPYYPFATVNQFMKIYPNYKNFLSKKLEIDPEEKFVSEFYYTYFYPKQQNVVNNLIYYFNNNYSLINFDTFNKFCSFIDNIIIEIDSSSLKKIGNVPIKREDFYLFLQKKLNTQFRYTLGGSYFKKYEALNKLKKDLTKQFFTLLPSNNTYHGLLEIGYPGRFIKSFSTQRRFEQNHLKTPDNICLINEPYHILCDPPSFFDYIESEFSQYLITKRYLLNYNNIQSEDNQPINNTYDIITCFIGLHHFEDPINFIKKIHNYLKQDGLFFLIEHDVQTQQDYDTASFAHVIYNIVNNVPLHEEMSERRNFHSIKYWTQLIESCGFKIQNNGIGLLREGDTSNNKMIYFKKVYTS